MSFSKWFYLGVAIAVAATLSSCNTFLGLGRDLQQAGEGIENTVYGR
ncbi:MAG: hypothetical protein AAGC74_14135 [Verrucomicrobiota bacterium]